MGWKWEVKAWRKMSKTESLWHKVPYGTFHYETVYAGQYLIAAIFAAIKAKKTAGCVRIEWR